MTVSGRLPSGSATPDGTGSEDAGCAAPAAATGSETAKPIRNRGTRVRSSGAAFMPVRVNKIGLRVFLFDAA